MRAIVVFFQATIILTPMAIANDTWPMVGDFNLDGQLGVEDVDTLSWVIVRGSGPFDVNADGLVNAADQHAWLWDLRNVFRGDTDFDGDFDSDDIILAMQPGEYEDGVPHNSTWIEGDWNGDLEFDSSDFLAAIIDNSGDPGPRRGRAVGWIFGDFSRNHVLDAADVDMLSRMIVIGTSEYDLNQDQQLDQQDLSVWINDLKLTWIGDANLDGAVTTADLILALSAGTFEADVDAGWADGDWNADLRFTVGDLIWMLSSIGECGMEGHGCPRPSVPAAAPEPVSLGLFVYGAGLWLIFSRWQQR